MQRDREAANLAREDQLDEALSESFPASDPPSFVTAKIGAPRRPQDMAGHDMAKTSDLEDPRGGAKAWLALSLPG